MLPQTEFCPLGNKGLVSALALRPVKAMRKLRVVFMFAARCRWWEELKEIWDKTRSHLIYL